MKMLVGPSVLLLCAVCVRGSQFLSNDRRTQPNALANGTDGGKPLTGTAHIDNFQDELVDQADPEFMMVSGGDNCISLEDAQRPLVEQFQDDAPGHEFMSEAERKEDEEIREQMMADLKMMFEHADTSKDGCVDQAEFKKAAEMEGPPPGFQKEKKEEIQKQMHEDTANDTANSNETVKDEGPHAPPVLGTAAAGANDTAATAAAAEEEFETQSAEEDRVEFNSLDRNGDEKISRPEVYHYAGENMPQADVDSTEVDRMFKEADVDEDGFLSFEEFTGSGKAIEGDGNEMETAEPMSLKLYAARESASRVVVVRKLLAHKPPFRMIANLLSDAPSKRAPKKTEEATDDAPASEQEASDDGSSADTAGEPLKGPAHTDNFQVEIVDQAYAEFAMMAGGDGCISWEDAKKPVEEQFQEGAPDRVSMSEADRKEEDQIKRKMLENARVLFDYADALGTKNGCIDKAEFKKAGEMEGNPPGYQKENTSEMSEEEFKKEELEEDQIKFNVMDRNGDKQVSETEAFHYASENLPQADVDAKYMHEMFQEVDTNKDDFLSPEEFNGAGKEVGSDGNEMETAAPMTSANGPMAFKIYMNVYSARMRAKMSKTSLAHRPHLKFLNREI